jgi:serine/threonine protein kinase
MHDEDGEAELDASHPRHIDRYELLKKLATGGMAEIFLAKQSGLEGFEKVVVLKRILSHLAQDEEFVSMFLDEARIAAKLSHPNIVQIYDLGKADSSFYIAMEYVSGRNVQHIIAKQQQRGEMVPVEHVCRVVAGVCDGLHYAHSRKDYDGTPLNIVHRDISPPNIMLSQNGEVKVVDFGLAKANSQVEITDQGVVKGKFAYLSPEAASGLAIDLRTDVFALGILLWEMFTGRRLFYADTPLQTVELVRRARIPSITAQNTSVEPELEQIVRKALARDMDERYESCAELGDALAQYLFSRGLKVTSRDIAALVRDTKVDIDKKRESAPRASLVDALITDELNRLTSLVGDDAVPEPMKQDVTGSTELVDTAAWAADLGLDEP